ncbi:MAG: hypothetical protein ABFE01_19680 [Phycisphaerales bacterium]|jgi:hypothetical protein
MTSSIVSQVISDGHVVTTFADGTVTKVPILDSARPPRCRPVPRTFTPAEIQRLATASPREQMERGRSK